MGLLPLHPLERLRQWDKDCAEQSLNIQDVVFAGQEVASVRDGGGQEGGSYEFRYAEMEKCGAKSFMAVKNTHRISSRFIAVCKEKGETEVGDFLTNRPQVVRIGDNTSSTLVLSTGTPQGCVLSPALFTLFTSDCSAIHSTNTIVKFADDTTIVGLISDNDETHYREEIQHLTQWCSNNNLVLNTSKTKEVIVDYRRSRRTEHAPLLIHDLVHEHSSPGKEGSTKTLLPQEAETCWTLPSAPDKLLQGHNREHPLPQCSSVVWQLHCTRPKGLSPGGENSTGGLLEVHLPDLDSNIRWPDAEEGPTYCRRPYPPGKWTVRTASIWKTGGQGRVSTPGAARDSMSCSKALRQSGCC
ncbi:hypothetical protein L3Q82_001681 [Scortum barcoo]|uniref:Uncharacterized protein n=1 Tax=Scortum barcoo TaxID=214431 RepID=A0ACB8W566_9TELE|nr:hypothetical protein L3Q82_001681 [Scortum barcoo]